MAKLEDYLKQLSEIPAEERQIFIEALTIKNYGSNELSETSMWILNTAAGNADYLENKLKENEAMTLDTEAPAEQSEELTLDTPSEETPTEGGETPTEGGETPTEGGETAPEGGETAPEGGETAPEGELTLDTPSEETPTEGGEELSLDTTTEEPDSTETTEEKEEIETSKEGIGILALIGEIQEKLANGKPTEVELAALKALKKLVV